MDGTAPVTHGGRPVRARAAGVLLVAALAVVVTASPAGAHVGGPTHGFADGALHPLTGVDHLLAMVAVGLVAALGASARRCWAAPTAFLAGMAVGGASGLLGASFPAVELAIVGSVLGLGVAVALALRVDAAWLLALVAVAGIAHGNAHGAEAPAAANPVLYIAGFVAVTAALHTVGLLGGTLVRRAPTARVLAGAGFAAAGVLLLV